MPVLEELQQAVSTSAESVGPSVVGLGRGWGRGSGVVTAAGTVLTNAHVLRGEEVAVTFADGRMEHGRVAGADADLDLAAIAVETGGAEPVAWEPERVDAVAIGKPVFALANPGGRGLRTTFGLVSAFGNGTDPGTALPYREIDRSDWWAYDPTDPTTYNVLQTRRVASAVWRRSWAEDLSGYGEQYRYVAVLDFNLPSGVHRATDGQRVADQPADTRLGGGIFLHVSGPAATAGCVSVRRATMRRTLQWLDPAQHPVIVMGPLSAIDRL